MQLHSAFAKVSKHAPPFRFILTLNNYEFLSVSVDNRSQQFPCSTLAVNPDQPQDLEEPKATQRRSCVYLTTKTYDNKTVSVQSNKIKKKNNISLRYKSQHTKSHEKKTCSFSHILPFLCTFNTGLMESCSNSGCQPFGN